jgi:hypothetical protein
MHVTTNNKGSVDGIPFYVKQGQCVHKMVYIVPYYRLTLQTLDGKSVLSSDTLTISEDAYVKETAVRDLLVLLSKNSNPPVDYTQVRKDWDAIRNDLAANPYDAVQKKSWPQYLVSNSTTANAFVDYSTTYYLNAKSPLVGSVNADYKLASDGTLTEASAQITDQTLSTILSALPISSLITTAASGGVLMVSPEGTVAPRTQSTVQMTAEWRAIKITNSQAIPYVIGCPDQDGFAPNPPIGTLIEDVGADTAAASQTKPDDNSITVTGKITLPKPKDAGSATSGGGQTPAPAPAPGTAH